MIISTILHAAADTPASPPAQLASRHREVRAIFANIL